MCCFILTWKSSRQAQVLPKNRSRTMTPCVIIDFQRSMHIANINTRGGARIDKVGRRGQHPNANTWTYCDRSVASLLEILLSNSRSKITVSYTNSEMVLESSRCGTFNQAVRLRTTKGFVYSSAKSYECDFLRIQCIKKHCFPKVWYSTLNFYDSFVVEIFKLWDLINIIFTILKIERRKEESCKSANW